MQSATTSGTALQQSAASLPSLYTIISMYGSSATVSSETQDFNMSYGQVQRLMYRTNSRRYSGVHMNHLAASLANRTTAYLSYR